MLRLSSPTLEGGNDAASLHPDSEGRGGDKTVAMLARRHSTGARCTTDTVRTPVERSAVFIAPHCQLMYEMGCQQAIRGVCDLDYINIPDVKKRAALSGNTSAQNPIEDCGSSMAPDIERIIALNPEAILLSPSKTAEDMASSTSCTCPSSRLPTIWSLRHWAGRNG